jgi:hypothetical protein
MGEATQKFYTNSETPDQISWKSKLRIPSSSPTRRRRGGWGVEEKKTRAQKFGRQKKKTRSQQKKKISRPPPPPTPRSTCRHHHRPPKTTLHDDRLQYQRHARTCPQMRVRRKDTHKPTFVAVSANTRRSEKSHNQKIHPCLPPPVTPIFFFFLQFVLATTTAHTPTHRSLTATSTARISLPKPLRDFVSNIDRTGGQGGYCT